MYVHIMPLPPPHFKKTRPNIDIYINLIDTANLQEAIWVGQKGRDTILPHILASGTYGDIYVEM